MKQIKNSLVGDPVRLDRFTADWMSIKLHPITFYRRESEFRETLSKIKGLYAEIEMINYIIIKFSEKDDLTFFHKNHHMHI